VVGQYKLGHMNRWPISSVKMEFNYVYSMKFSSRLSLTVTLLLNPKEQKEDLTHRIYGSMTQLTKILRVPDWGWVLLELAFLQRSRYACSDVGQLLTHWNPNREPKTAGTGQAVEWIT